MIKCRVEYIKGSKCFSSDEMLCNGKRRCVFTKMIHGNNAEQHRENFA